MLKILKETGQEVQRHTQYNKIKEGKNNKYIKRCKYLEKEGIWGSQKLITNARCGNLDEGNKYWLKMEKEDT